jgi:hypothetical protein
MSYKTVADMAESYSLVRRLNAGAAKESIDNNVQWVQTYRWELASQPGWDAAWDSAVAAEVPDPGSDEAVITDGTRRDHLRGSSHEPRAVLLAGGLLHLQGV